jgi:hypothetical protein
MGVMDWPGAFVPVLAGETFSNLLNPSRTNQKQRHNSATNNTKIEFVE